jgi:hypothetical protein
MSPEARMIVLRIRMDADTYLLRALKRIALLGRRETLLDRYIAGRLGTGW